MKLGLVCISDLLREKRPDLAFQSMTRSYFLKQKRDAAIIELSKRISHNLTVSIETIKHCADIGIKHYRLSSSLFPLLTEPNLRLELESFPNYDVIINKLREIGRTSYKCGVTLSIHPDQFVVLGSNNDDVCKNSIRELNFHGWMLDTIGVDDDYRCPINIHPSLSKFESPQSFVDKFVGNFLRCNTGVRNRLVVENEHGGFWNCNNLYEYFVDYCKMKYGFYFPLTLDNLHNTCNPSIVNGEVVDYKTLFFKFHQTWPFPPVFHWSEGVNNTSKHAQKLTLTPPDYGLECTYEIEIKDKDKGFYHLLPHFNYDSFINNPVIGQ